MAQSEFFAVMRAALAGPAACASAPGRVGIGACAGWPCRVRDRGLRARQPLPVSDSHLQRSPAAGTGATLTWTLYNDWNLSEIRHVLD